MLLQMKFMRAGYLDVDTAAAYRLTGDAVSEMQAPEVTDPNILEHSTNSSMADRTTDSITDAATAAASGSGGGNDNEEPKERPALCESCLCELTSDLTLALRP